MIDYGCLRSSTKEKTTRINEIYKNIAKENNILFISINNNDYYAKNTYNYPTTNGYKKISKTIIKAIDIQTKY